MRKLVQAGLLTEEEYSATPVYVYQTTTGEKGIIKGQQALKMFRALNKMTECEELGLDIKQIGLHSLRSAAAMAMYMNRVPVHTIILLGKVV